MYVCGQIYRGIGENIIDEINFVGFWFGCWDFSSPQFWQLILKCLLKGKCSLPPISAGSPKKGGD